MLFNDTNMLVNLIMIEVLGTIFFLAVVSIYIYLRRFFVRKSLNGCTALITNGETNLAQELATQLTAKHNCRVILLNGKNHKNGKIDENVLNTNPSGITMFNCDILNNAELEEFSQTIYDRFDGIDIVIDNGIVERSTCLPKDDVDDDVRAFVDTTGDRLRKTINLLMHFVPKMKNSTCGHFVTIESMKPDKKPDLSSYRGYNEMIQHLTDNQSMFADGIFNRQSVRLTTVFCKTDDLAEAASLTSNDHSNNNEHMKQENVHKIAERIVDGIRANRSSVNINQDTNTFDFMLRYFKRKIK